MLSALSKASQIEDKEVGLRQPKLKVEEKTTPEEAVKRIENADSGFADKEIKKLVSKPKKGTYMERYTEVQNDIVAIENMIDYMKDNKEDTTDLENQLSIKLDELERVKLDTPAYKKTKSKADIERGKSDDMIRMTILRNNISDLTDEINNYTMNNKNIPDGFNEVLADMESQFEVMKQEFKEKHNENPQVYKKDKRTIDQTRNRYSINEVSKMIDKQNSELLTNLYKKNKSENQDFKDSLKSIKQSFKNQPTNMKRLEKNFQELILVHFSVMKS